MFKYIAFLALLMALATSEHVEHRCERFSHSFTKSLAKNAKIEKDRNTIVNLEYSSAMAFCREHKLCDTPCYREIFACLDAQRIFDFVLPDLHQCCRKCNGLKV